jgi:hypothetical protein
VGALTPERERERERETERERERETVRPPSAPGRAPHRPFPWALAVLGTVVVAAIVVPGWLGGLVPEIPNPFASRTVDRGGPAVLQSIRDLRELRAASGHFEVIVDLERDTKLPAAILGERVLFVAVGDVDATVDLADISAEDVAVSSDRRSATITLPRPRLSDAQLDLRRSYVYDRQRGVLDEIGGLFGDGGGGDREVYLAAQRKLNEAARNGAGLIPRAEQNTRRTLESLLSSLGFTDVDVRFEPQT